ncbi:alpha/beta hydrolase fold-domain-containing protein [Sporodiniella umbellata]|nr:alpha/beta hydrolase fold-domain-containing protein [Sporodiniella umbellata]
MAVDAPPVPVSQKTLQSIADTLGVSKEEASSLDNLRSFFIKLSEPHVLDKDHRQDRTVEFDDKKVLISIIKPLGHENKVLPVIFYIHGGGWMTCDYIVNNQMVHELANRANAYIVFPHYTFSPEVKHPVALEECYAALQWVKENGETLNFDLSRLSVAGDSAGGNLSAAISILCNRKKDNCIKQQVIVYPVTDHDFEKESYKQYGDVDLLNTATLKYMWDSHVENEQDYESPLLCPARASDSDMLGLPPALVISAQEDILRDETEEYAVKLKQANVDTTSIRINNIAHGFFAFALPKLCPESIFTIQIIAGWLQEKWFPKY